MARSLTLSNVIDKNKIASDVAWIFALDIDVTDRETGQHIEMLHICRNDEAIQVGGNTYQPLWFDVEVNEREGELPEVALSLQDQSQTIMYYMQNYNGGVGFTIDLLVVPIKHGESIGTLEAELSERFYITGASANSGGYTVSWTLGAENPLAILFPNRAQMRDRCTYEYQSPECGYNGPLGTCLRTFEDCEAHSNTENYGGFPAIKARQ